MSAPSIKLVIWDLDETFWQGTLSEGPITPIERNLAVVQELSKRGIVNSICSKNDSQAAQTALTNLGIRDHFVFPRISWNPKGPQIASLIEDMGLRAENVLFLDDNPQNLEEAKYFAPGISVEPPDAIVGLLERPQLAGKPDPDLTRLRQYQLLEQKNRDRTTSSSSNEDFLRSCEIQISLHDDCPAQFDRLLELNNRTNQLNFTKTLLTGEKLRELLSDPHTQSGYVHVRDRYGDYGVCGFFAIRDGTLLQYLFSCRILNMGVESWLYQHLARPALTIQTPVAGDPFAQPTPDWISLTTERKQNEATPPATDNAYRPTLLLKGGCDLAQLADFLDVGLRVTTEFNYNSAQGIPVHREHTELLRQATGDNAERYRSVWSWIPFLDRGIFETQIFSGKFDVVVYSPLMDLTQAIYRHPSGMVFTYGDFTRDMTDEANRPSLLRRRPELQPETLQRIGAEFRFEGGLSPERLLENLDWMRAELPPRTLLIVLTAAEVPLEHALERDRHQHHRRMNRLLESFVAAHPQNVALCDVRKFVHHTDDLTDNLRHYTRRIHRQIADEITTIVSQRWKIHSTPFANALTRLFKTLIRYGRLGKKWLRGRPIKSTAR